MKKILAFILIVGIFFGIYKGYVYLSTYGLHQKTEVLNTDSVIEYVSKNINALSPQKSSEGENFRVTNITIDGDGGEVEYEDNANAYTGSFSFEYTESGKVSVTRFEILQ